MHRHIASTIAFLLFVVAASVQATDLSIWARNSDIGFEPTSIAYNPVSGKLLLAGDDLVEWERGASAGTVLAPGANWGGSPYACVYVPSRGSYMVTDGVNDDIIEVLPGVAGQTPAVFLNVSAAAPASPTGGLVQDGTHAYYKYQVSTPSDQAVHRFTLAGTNGVDSEHVPLAAFQAWSSYGPSLQMAMGADDTLYVSARTYSSFKLNRGIYRWDSGAGALVPVVQAPAIHAHTGQSSVTVYGLAIDDNDRLYFYDIYSSDILTCDTNGVVDTFLTDTEVEDFMAAEGLANSNAFHPSYMAVIGHELVFITGNISGHVLAARLPLEIETVTIPGTDFETNGPAYTYEIGKYEVTNAQYCDFLNNAELIQQTDPSHPRCTHMWIDPANGDVYMMDVTVFPFGSEWYDRTLYKTSDIPDSKIKYDLAQPPGSRFYVLAGYADHPVGTVSWFGAAKFCNWLTIDRGLDASEVCYREGTYKTDWYAITASNWTLNGMLEQERLDLVRNYQGYRLPMDGINIGDGGPADTWSWNMDANPYNEWYKAAAFDPAAPDTVRIGPGEDEEAQPDHWIYGYGSDVNTNADANLANSGDPFAETTPIGWYNGVNTLIGGLVTNDTRNRYGLYDMCGNMAEWINDTALEYPWGAATYRVVRGGSWGHNDLKYVTNSIRIITSARYYAENSIGFRVARSFGYGDFDADDDIDLDDFDFFATAMTGPVGTVVPGCGQEACDYNGDNHVDLLDFAKFQALFQGTP